MNGNKIPAAFATPADVFTYFEKFTNLEQGRSLYTAQNYNLNRMACFLDHFSHPEQAVPAIHIAGSKGKGSTAVLLAGALQAAGYKTGLYTSPHVVSYLERIRVDNQPPAEDLIIELAGRIQAMLMSLAGEKLPGGEALDQPTTFELLTLLSWLVFRATRCEFTVIETGLGGRLDATNLITPLASLITPIDLEHTRVLGDTLEQIAREKCGIIKNRVPVFAGLQQEAVKAVIRDTAAAKDSPVYFLDEELSCLETGLKAQGTAVTLRLKGGAELTFSLRLPGNFQAENAALAYLTLTHLLPEFPVRAVRTGFHKAWLPGRFEIFKSSPHLTFVMDGAHTPLAIERLLESFRKIFLQQSPAGKKTLLHTLLIFGTGADKNYGEMATRLAPHFSAIIISTPGRFKQSDPLQVYNCFKERQPATELELEPDAALQKALTWAEAITARKEQAVILVTGSFYMVAEIRKLLGI